MPLSPHKNHDIETLRAVAVLFVVVHHIGLLFTWDGAWTKLFLVTTFWSGVDLFFCVSGYVIASSLLRETRHGGGFFDFAVPFWIRRVWRIWPAAIVWLLIAILASRYFNRSGAFGSFEANIVDGVAAVTQVANFHFLNCWFYKQGLCGNQEIYWSLSLEEQFYFVFPFLLFFLPRRWLHLGLIAAILAQCFLHRPMASPLWAVRTDAICYGVLIALAANSSLKDKLYPYFLKSKPTAIGFSLVLMFLMAAVPTNHVVWFDTGLLAVICAILVFVASYDEKFILPVPVLGPVLLWVGSRSFAIYLTHTVCYWLTREIFFRLYPQVHFDPSFAFPFLVVAIGSIVLLSEATYRWIETPFRNKGREIAKRYRAGRRPEPPPGTNTTNGLPATSLVQPSLSTPN